MNIADLLPARARRVIYTVLGAAILLEAIWDLVPEPLEGRVLASLSALGFGLAFSKTKD